MIVDKLNALWAETGLFVRGGFHPAPADGVPALADGRVAATVLVIGNAGNVLWHAFRRDNPGLHGKDPLDAWVDRHLDRAAVETGAAVVYATRRPWPPIQRWALKCEPVHPSPVGLLIHPSYGLWHAYRGALLYPGRLDGTAAPATRPSPCESCAGQPCLTTCPVDAFQPGSFNSEKCADHVESAKGRACAVGGCLVRRACPVGRDFAYEREPGAFHMAAVVKSVRRMQAKRNA